MSVPTPCRDCARQESSSTEIPFHEYAKAERHSGELVGPGESLIQRQELEVAASSQEGAADVATGPAFEASTSSDQPVAPVVSDAASGGLVGQVALESMSLIAPSLVAIPDAAPSGTHIPQDVSVMNGSASLLGNLATDAQGDLVSSTGTAAARSMIFQQLEVGSESHRLVIDAETTTVRQASLEQLSSMSKQVLGAASQSKESLRLSGSPESASALPVDKLRSQLHQKAIQSRLSSANESTSPPSHGDKSFRFETVIYESGSAKYWLATAWRKSLLYASSSTS